MVNLTTGEVGRARFRIACKDRRHVVCPSCSYLTRTDAWILVSTGSSAARAHPKRCGTHPRLFVTVTAPSFGAVHTIKARGGLRWSSKFRRDERQRHLQPRTCEGLLASATRSAKRRTRPAPVRRVLRLRGCGPVERARLQAVEQHDPDDPPVACRNGRRSEPAELENRRPGALPQGRRNATPWAWSIFISSCERTARST